MNHQDETNKGTAVLSPAPELAQLYLEHFPTIKAAIHESFPGLSFTDVDAIMERLASRLHRFTGTAAEFLPYAERYCKLWARHQSLYLLCVTHPKNVRAIRSAIRRTVHADYEDCAITGSEDIFGEICLYLYSHCNGFISKATDTAKLSTRLYTLAARHCEYYHNAYRYRRFNIVAENVTTLGLAGTEFLSPVELASIRSDEGEGDDAA